jgi:hypothetical protein
MAQTNQVAVRLSVEGSEQVKAALLSLGATGEAALKRLNFDTATGGSRLFGATLEEADGIARQYTSSLGPLGGILSTLGGGWLAAGAAAAGFGLVLEQSVSKAEAYEQAMRGVDAVLQATGFASGVTREQIASMAEGISEHTLQTRESVLAAAEELATFGVEGPKAFQRTLDAASDLAASPVFHGDLAAAVKAIALASEGTVTQLQRAGIALSAQQKQQIKDFDEQGDHAGALNVVLTALEGRIGGAGAAQDQGLTGATHNLGEAWDHLLTTMGQSDHAGGVATRFLNGITESLKEIEKVGQSEGFINALSLFGGGVLGGSKFGVVSGGGHAPGGASPHETDFSGLALALKHNQAVIDSTAALGQFGKSLDQQAAELSKPKLTQAIDKAINEAAKAAGISPDQLRNNPAYAGQLASITGSETNEYNAQHASEFANKASEAARKAQEAFNKWLNEEQRWAATLVKDVADQEKLFEDLTHKQDEAYAQMVEAQDAFRIDLLKGTSDYYGAAEKQINDWLTNQSKAIDSERDKEIAALDAKAAGYAKDSVAFAEYQLDKTTIEQTADDKRAALQAQAEQRQLDLQRQQAGALQQFIDAENADWNQSLKQVAADGLNQVGNDIEGLIKGTESLGKALKQLPLDIMADLAKKSVEKYILGPIGDQLNSLIGGPSGSKPDGTQLNPIYVVPVGGLGIPGLNGAGIFADIASFFGFAAGGEFDVGGSGGTDSQFVAFRATPGERVSVRTPGQQQQVPSVTVVVQGHVYGDEALKKTMLHAAQQGASLGYSSVKRDLPALMSDAQARFG